MTNTSLKLEINSLPKELRAEVNRLDSELKSMTLSRNDYQKKAADAINQVAYWKRRAEKAGK